MKYIILGTLQILVLLIVGFWGYNRSNKTGEIKNNSIIVKVKFMKHLSLLVVTSLLLFTLGCSNNPEKAIDFGKFEGGTYSNTFFNFNLSIPESWYVMDDEARIALMQRSKKIVAGNDKNLSATLNAADLQNLNLITAYEKPPGAPVDSNPSLIIIAESIKHAPGITKGSDYHFHTKKIMESSQMDVSFPKDIYKETISGKTFDVMDIEINMGSVRNIQKQYAAIINQYALLFIITYQDNNGLKQLEQILQTVEIK